MLSRAFIVLWISMLVAMSGIGMVSPLLPVYVRDELHGPEFAVALSFSALALSQFVASPIMGRVGDRMGSKPFIVAGFLIYGAGAIGYVFAENWQVVIVCRALSGIGAAGIFPMSLAYVGRLAPRGREGEFMGMFSVAQVAGFGLGPLLGGIISDAVSANAAFTAMATMLFAVGLLTLLLLPPDSARARAAAQSDEDNHPLMSMRELIRRPIVQAASAGQMVVSLGWGAGSTFLAVYIVSEDGLNTGSAAFVGVLLAARSVIGASFQPLTGRLADRTNRVAMVLIGLGGASLGQFIVPDMPSQTFDVHIGSLEMTVLPWLLVLFVGIGIAEAISVPAQQAIFVAAGRTVGMSSIMGLSQMGQSFGFLAGSLVGAAVVEVWGLAAVFRYAGLVVGGGTLLFYLLMRRARAEFEEAQALERAQPATAYAGH